METLLTFAKLHPWLSSVALVALLGGAWAMMGARRKKPWKLLRSKAEQAKFSPVQTVYNAKQYRREK